MGPHRVSHRIDSLKCAFGTKFVVHLQYCPLYLVFIAIALVECIAIPKMEMDRNTLVRSGDVEQPFPHQLTAVILAGGLGTRLRSVVQDRPKVLANVAGRPFLTYVLDQIVCAGIKRAVVCTGYLGDSISDVLNDDYKGLQLVYSHETTPLGTAGALRHGLPLVQKFPVLVFNGDSYVNVDLDGFVKFHYECKSTMTMALAKKQCSGAFGLVELGERGVVKRFSEKESTGKSEWVNAGIYSLEKQLIESIPEGQNISFEREILPKWIGHGLYGYAQQGELFDIGTPLSLSEAQHIFGERASKTLTYS